MHKKLKCPVWVTKRRLGVDQPQQKVSCQGRPLGLQGIVQVQIRSWTSICSQALNYSRIRDYFKSTCRGLAADISPFDTHSLRAGGASAAANAGVPDGLFQRHGRWKSISADGYVCQCQKSLVFNSLIFYS